MKSLTYDIDDFRNGLQLLSDDSEAAIGSARRMLNVLISDRGGIQTRPGTELLGTSNSSASGVKGFFNFKKSNGVTQLLMKAYDDELEVYNATSGWFRLKSSFTQDKQFGFITSLVNTDNDDFVYFCNRYQPYQRWRGAVTLLNGALVGAETAITVDSVLTSDVYVSDTATSNSATTITLSTASWATSQWVNFYVYVTAGVHSGKISLITANSGTVLTFDTLGSGPGNVTFEIRKAAFAATGTLIYGGTTIAYTAIPTATTFTVASAHAASDNTPITVVPQEYEANPKGNVIESLLGRIMVGNVRSALSRDSGGALQGSSVAGSIFVSKLNDPTSFTFSAARVAGEGDIIAMPYGGGDFTSIAVQEDIAYCYKTTYIEAISYSQDASDLAVRTPLKSGVGSVGVVIKGKDEHYFFTIDKQFTSVGRVSTKDTKPQTSNLGLSIKRLLDTYDFTTSRGIEYRNRVFIACKSDEDNNSNDIVLVWNKTTQSFEGVWSIPSFGFEIFNDLLYYAESNGANVWQMLKGIADKSGTTEFPITSVWESNFFNLLPIKGNFQGVNAVALEGYIRGNSEFTFNLYKDFATDSSLSFTFGGTEESFLVGADLASFLGANPLGLQPLGGVDSPGSDGRRRFSFIVYFPWVYAQYFSVGFRSEGTTNDYEIIRCSLGLRESVATKRTGIKSI